MKETNINNINFDTEFLETTKEDDEILEEIKLGKRQRCSNIEELIKSLDSGK